MNAATVEVLNRCMTQNTWRRARGSSRHCCNHWQNPAQASLMHHQPMPHTSVSQHRPPRANAVAPSGQTWSEYAPGMSTEGHPLVAWSLAAVAVLHTGLGMVTGWDVIKAGVAEGLVGVWAAPAERSATYWFLVTGASLMVLSTAVAELERRNPALPLPVTGGLAALTAAGVATMPASGFWTLTVPLAIAVVRRRRARRPRQSAE